MIINAKKTISGGQKFRPIFFTRNVPCVGCIHIDFYASPKTRNCGNKPNSYESRFLFNDDHFQLVVSTSQTLGQERETREAKERKRQANP